MNVEPGAVLHVDVIDGAGAPVPGHEVYLEDAAPFSPLMFQPMRTDQAGRVTFDRLASGRYRLRTRAGRFVRRREDHNRACSLGVWQWNVPVTSGGRRERGLPRHLVGCAADSDHDNRYAGVGSVRSTAVAPLFYPLVLVDDEALVRALHIRVTVHRRD